MLTENRALRVALLLAASTAPLLAQTAAPAVPTTRMTDQVDDYNGVSVRDPYRWLENDTSAETSAWVAAQNQVTFGYLAGIAARERIKQRLTQLWNYERYSTPWHEGGRFFYFKNDGLQNQSVLYTRRRLADPASVVIDPNTLSSDGTVALSVTEVAPDGRRLVVGTSASGSDWQEFKVHSLDAGTDLADHLRWIKFSGASWTRDGQGFFYSRYPEPAAGEALSGTNRNQALYYHRAGTSQASDRKIYDRPDQPDWGFGGGVTEDGRYLIVNVWLGTDRRNRLYYQELGDPRHPSIDRPMVPLLDDLEAAYDFIGNDGPVFFLRTDLDAPRARIIAIDTRKPERNGWRTVIPEATEPIQGVQLIGERFVVHYLKDAKSVVRFFTVAGVADGVLDLPGIGSVGGLSGKRDDREMFYSFTSFLYPTTIFRYDFRTRKSRVYQAPKVDFDASRYTTEQVFYQSKDRTRIPMFLIYRKDLKQDGSNPTFLYGYGGFNISLLPGFSVSRLAWLELGGIVAIPSLRGGGEYGEEWHQAGMREHKQNVFDDFIGAAEYLISQGYTSPARLAIAGGSNGGLLVGAAMTQRPELFAAALPAVGVMDMLRFHKFTIGWAWVTEYGSADSASQFPYLLKYSPLHNLKPGMDYPATLVTTADHDDRVVPAHSFKFAATLQAANAGRRPALIRIETKAGHGAGKPIAKVIEEEADKWAFLVKNLGVEVTP